MCQLRFNLIHAAIGESRDSASDSGASLQAMPSVHTENETVEETLDGRTLVTETFHDENSDDDLQMTYEIGISIKPVELGVQVKLNDQITGNMPFRENV